MKTFSARQRELSDRIASGEVVVIADMTNISLEGDIFYTWGDVEEIGYGKSNRWYNRYFDESSVSRTYTGPGKIRLHPCEREMQSGTTISDRDE